MAKSDHCLHRMHRMAIGASVVVFKDSRKKDLKGDRCVDSFDHRSLVALVALGSVDQQSKVQKGIAKTVPIQLDSRLLLLYILLAFSSFSVNYF